MAELSFVAKVTFEGNWWPRFWHGQEFPWLHFKTVCVQDFCWNANHLIVRASKVLWLSKVLCLGSLNNTDLFSAVGPNAGQRRSSEHAGDDAEHMWPCHRMSAASITMCEVEMWSVSIHLFYLISPIYDVLYALHTLDEAIQAEVLHTWSSCGALRSYHWSYVCYSWVPTIGCAGRRGE